MLRRGRKGKLSDTVDCYLMIYFSDAYGDFLRNETYEINIGIISDSLKEDDFVGATTRPLPARSSAFLREMGVVLAIMACHFLQSLFIHHLRSLLPEIAFRSIKATPICSATSLAHLPNESLFDSIRPLSNLFLGVWLTTTGMALSPCNRE